MHTFINLRYIPSNPGNIITTGVSSVYLSLTAQSKATCPPSFKSRNCLSIILVGFNTINTS